MFKLINANPEVYSKTRKRALSSEILNVLETISSGDVECVRIEYPEGHYSSPYNCAKSFKNAIIHYGFEGRLHCFVRDEVTYIRKLV